MPFQVPTFDSLLNEILTDYKNQFPEADTSRGSLIFIKASALASCFWGLFLHQSWVSRQTFPDTADSEALEHHAWLRGLTRKEGESDRELLVRLLDHLRRPPAGGNRYDYVKWALEVEHVKAAYCIPLGQGLGTVDLVIVSDPATGSEIPSQDLIDEVWAHVDDLRPVTAKYIRVLAPELLTQNVLIEGTGSDFNKVQTALDITAYLNSFSPGQTLYRSQLANMAIVNGAADVSVTLPVANVVPTAQQIIRPGVINVP